ncbi:pirin family protein [Muriicola soli]|uniref:Pirin family protein n=1 Tax=Muriicola soli TaxID=2507538 RepID=A0A411E6U8_9FLAO|nr:pirin family protein [Muriicola soli]QBA63421.1 pirin family protein [Muriicola soli]
MKKILHKASTRGFADHGWLRSHHTFSFAGYHDPSRMNFGVLRVLNDDEVAGGMGFGTHPHQNMEIISIPLEGELEHKDSMGNVAVIKEGDVQVMSAGTGVNHSERNKNRDKKVKFLQIWVLPNKVNVSPRYDQITLDQTSLKNTFHQIISPDPKDIGVWIHQDAWFHLGDFDKGETISYGMRKKSNGLYIFLLEGKCRVAGEELNRRDGLGVWQVNTLEFEMMEAGQILLMEIPMSN